ncbi:hypothetical protein MJO28_017871 [Puccinia striiformis f. sp. tritici]|nr:hypothetical protein MJO28_017871 [Puccinia striiformis f. sp. tritici]
MVKLVKRVWGGDNKKIMISNLGSRTNGKVVEEEGLGKMIDMEEIMLPTNGFKVQLDPRHGKAVFDEFLGTLEY